MGIEKFERKKPKAKMTMAEFRQCVLDVTDKTALLTVWKKLYEKACDGNLPAIIEFNNRTMGKLQDSDIYETLLGMQAEILRLEASHNQRISERTVEMEAEDDSKEDAAGDDGGDVREDQDDGGLRGGELH